MSLKSNDVKHYCMARKREMFQFRMDEGLRDHLEQLAGWDDCSMAESVRDAIEEAWRRRLAAKMSIEKKPRL